MDSMTREELNQHLFALVGSDQLVQQWWVTHNPDEVVTYVMRFCYGDYS
jgi:ABC-type nitrate/sulfonate/bicarbonate transport system ATPase subunit